MSTKRFLAKFSNYDRYNINKAYNFFFQKLIKVVDSIPPFKTARIKYSSKEWFDREIAGKLCKVFKRRINKKTKV